MQQSQLKLFKKSKFLHGEPILKLAFRCFGSYDIVVKQMKSGAELELKAPTNVYDSDYEDAQNWTCCNSIPKLFERYRRPGVRYNIDDMIKFLMHAANLIEQSKQPLPNKYKSHILSLVDSIKQDLKHSRMEYPLIGSLAYSLRIINFTKNDLDVWLLMGDYVASDRIRKSANEIKKATIGLTDLKHNTHDDSYTDSVFRVLEDEFGGTLSLQLSAQTYNLILKSFIANRSETTKIFALLEPRVLKSCEFEKDCNSRINPTTLLEIAENYALTGHGSHNFYQKLLDLIMLQQFPDERGQLNIFSKGNTIASLALILSQGSALHPTLNTSQHIAKLFQLFDSEDVYFSLSDLIKAYLHGVAIYPEDQASSRLWSLLTKKIFLVERTDRLSEVIQFYDLLRASEEDNDDVDDNNNNNIAILSSRNHNSITDQLQKICSASLQNSDPQQLLSFLPELEDRRLLTDFQKFLQKVPPFVEENVRVYDFENMCFLYYFIKKHQDLVVGGDAEPNTGMLEHNLGVLKEWIKIHYASTPRHKIPISSNFYKVLEVVDINEFFLRADI